MNKNEFIINRIRIDRKRFFLKLYYSIDFIFKKYVLCFVVII